MTHAKHIFSKLTDILLLVIVSMSGALIGCSNSSSDEIRSKAQNHFSRVYEASNEFKIDTIQFINATAPYYLTDGKLDKVFKKAQDNFVAALFATAIINKDADGLKKHHDELDALFKKTFQPLQNLLDSVEKSSNIKQNMALIAYSPIDNTKDGKAHKIIYILGDNEENIILDSIPISKDIKDKANMIAVSKIDFMDNVNQTSEEIDDAAKKLITDSVLKFIVD